MQHFNGWHLKVKKMTANHIKSTQIVNCKSNNILHRKWNKIILPFPCNIQGNNFHFHFLGKWFLIRGFIKNSLKIIISKPSPSFLRTHSFDKAEEQLKFNNYNNAYNNNNNNNANILPSSYHNKQISARRRPWLDYENNKNFNVFHKF